MPEKTTAKVGCGSFDQSDLQSLNDRIFVFFVLRLQFHNSAACNIPLERYFQNLSNGILHDPKFLNFLVINPKINVQSFSVCKSGWSKNRSRF